ncbi:MAG TPA: heavy-metal-associated domain-containing protein [Erysipelotrichaceae bacterium]|nr:heavy-metal-associated domain-containing protein [Erysipelotrichaceae bacterium]
MKSATLQLESLACPSCLQKIENGMKALDGIDKDSVKVMFNASRVKLSFNEEVIEIDKIQDSIEKLGYEVLKVRVK